MRLMLKRRVGLYVSTLLLLIASLGHSQTTYYIDATNGNNASPGTSPAQAWQSVTKVANQTFQAGDAILLKCGESWEETLEIKNTSNGNAQAPITIADYGEGSLPVIQKLVIRGDYIVARDLVIEHNKTSGNAVALRSTKNCVLHDLTVRNGLGNGIDADEADGLRIHSCLVHHFLAGSTTVQVDAHGIVLTRTRNVTVRNTEVHHVSGDSFQADPARGETNDLRFKNCHFWTGPLSEDFNEGWLAGDIPGENAVDTKASRNRERMRLTFQNITAHGWTSDAAGTAVPAAFNMKENIDAVFDGVTVYDCHVAFRIRNDADGNADTTLMNALVYDCDDAIRAEDNLQNLKVYNSTFGKSFHKHLLFAPSGAKAGLPTWDLRNNAFYLSKPLEASDTSNKRAQDRDFLDVAQANYKPKPKSKLVDSGVTIPEVAVDRDSMNRPQGVGYDIGAYELPNVASNALNRVDEQVALEDGLLQNYPNPFNPETWMPFELATDAEVTITIYDTQGSKVRTIDLGFQPAGVYRTKAQAGFWDGRNGDGEHVASGVYFYQMQAGDYTATRKMLIMK